MGNTGNSVEIRKVSNGFFVVVNDEVEYKEYVFAKESQVIKFLKDYFKAD